MKMERRNLKKKEENGSGDGQLLNVVAIKLLSRASYFNSSSAGAMYDNKRLRLHDNTPEISRGERSL